MSVPLGAGVILFGLLVRMWMLRRAFMRTNESGVQLFSGFTVMILTRLFEACVRIVSLFMILVGLMMVLISVIR